VKRRGEGAEVQKKVAATAATTQLGIALKRGFAWTLWLAAWALVAVVLVRATSAAGERPYEQIQVLARDMTFRWAALHPSAATQLGIPGSDGLLETPSLAADERDLALIRGWEARLAGISIDAEPQHVRDDAALLLAQLVGMERQLTVYKTDRKDYSAAGTALIGAIFTQFQNLPASGSGRAWADITARLARSPAYIAAAEALVTEPGHLQGVVGAQQLAGAPDFLSHALTDAARAQLPRAAFVRFARARDAALVAIAREKAYIDAGKLRHGPPGLRSDAARRTTRAV
jgi:hypothetical protein